MKLFRKINIIFKKKRIKFFYLVNISFEKVQNQMHSEAKSMIGMGNGTNINK